MKAVVVIDMPSKCVMCRLLKPGLNNYCPIGELTPADIWHKRDDNCPLRPLPEKWERQPYNSQSRVDWKIGYNNCLDDIQGIEDKNERENQWWAEHSSRFD